MAEPFRIGINMAGAVSAGAYTAGVLDFLVEALDAWYAEREKWKDKDPSTWPIPSHDVSLEVLSGASAGGMCAAISAVALQEEFDTFGPSRHRSMPRSIAYTTAGSNELMWNPCSGLPISRKTQTKSVLCSNALESKR